ncbi:hypothetical protein ACLB2K_069688 [Fragaria x ananassa]
MGASGNPNTSSALQKRIFPRRLKPLNATVSTQEFNSFHAIDRRLFTRLVLGLGRDPTESAQVMALWMWLERYGGEVNLVYKALMTLPDSLLDSMANESISALNCIRSNVVPFSDLDIVPGIPMLQAMSSSGVTLGYFYENCGEIASGVITLLKDVCLRVFEDLLFEKIAQGNVKGGDDVPLYWHRQLNSANLYYLRGGFVSDQELAVQRKDLNNEMEEVLRCLNVNDLEVVKVHPQDRTIFLTFSKGHPLSENELRDFFTRNFGEIIDEILIAKEPLYGRLVLHSASSIPVVLGVKGKVQFSINGRHVRARKFVPKDARAGQRRD